MKRKLLGLFLGVVMGAAMLTGCGSSSGSSSGGSKDSSAEAGLQKYIDQGYITVGTSNDAPISFVDQSTGEFVGFDGEIIKEACNRLGIKEVKVETMDFSNLIVALNSGKIDMICTV